jgi:hypothetical protein
MKHENIWNAPVIRHYNSDHELSPAPAWEKEVQAKYSCEKHPYFDTIS